MLSLLLSVSSPECASVSGPDVTDCASGNNKEVEGEEEEEEEEVEEEEEEEEEERKKKEGFVNKGRTRS